ncbi:MAG: energy transducer TonB [Elusimicrobia bacterium]|nr:energy transducer TonB [Elusimicrobiota bacterium]
MTAAIAIERRLSASLLTSLGLHAALLGLYVIHKIKQQKLESTVLTDVELLEPVVPAAFVHGTPAQRAPQSPWEFLKMALPQIRKTAPMEQEVETQKSETKLMEPEKLTEAEKPLLRKSSEIDLKLKREAAPKQLEEALASSAALPEKIQTAAPMEPISLEEVGAQRAPKAMVEQALEFEKKGYSRPTQIAEGTAPSLPTQVPKAPAAPLSLAPEARGGPPQKPPTLPPQLPLGYSRGAGGALQSPVRPPPAVEKTQILPREEAAPESALRGERKKSVEITGPLSQRKIVKAFVPKFPEWAKKEGILEAEVLIRFFVSPEGTVLKEARIERTSGHGKLDALALETLRQWRFAPLGPEEAAQNQWGFITFRFLLE